MILHTVNKNRDCLQRCFAMVQADDAIVLIEDGVYAAMDSAENQGVWQALQDTPRCYVLEGDLAARGISDKLLPFFEKTDWPGFVALSITYDKVISWG